MRSTAVGLAVMLAACGHKAEQPAPPAVVGKDAALPIAPGDAPAPSDAALALAPAPPLPAVPLGLPPLPETLQVDADEVALGEALFYDPRLSASGQESCATCHDPAHGFAGDAQRPAADGKPNLRRAPALVNLAWVRALAWDGRYASIADELPAHVKGQLGRAGEALVAALAGNAGYRAHFARIGDGAAPSAALAIRALAAYVLTRYAGDSPWDRAERDQTATAEEKAGYAVFSGKAQCSVCHTPPLYSDDGFHALGLIHLADEGRGRVDPTKPGAFRTPTLRGAASRPGFFHDGSAATLDAAIDWHLAGGVGQGADRSIIDPALQPVTLTAEERQQLGVFVRALTAIAPTPAPPVLP